MNGPIKTSGWLTAATIIGVAATFVSLALIAASPYRGEYLFPYFWKIEPLAAIGAVGAIGGLVITSAALLVSYRVSRNRLRQATTQLNEFANQWSDVTLRSFQSYRHDLLRPFERVRDKEKGLSVLLDSVGTLDQDSTQELLNEIKQQSEAFQLMMSNVQALIQIEGPSSSFRAEPLRPKEIVQGIIDRYQAIVKESGKQISYYSDPDEFGFVNSDAAVIQHIITNLVDNASRFANGRIQIRLGRNDKEFYISVWDDGPGVSKDERPHVFERGWTQEASMGKVKTSAGLGLFISQTLSLRAGGSLIVEGDLSQPESAANTFVLALPVGR